MYVDLEWETGKTEQYTLESINGWTGSYHIAALANNNSGHKLVLFSKKKYNILSNGLITHRITMWEIWFKIVTYI